MTVPVRADARRNREIVLRTATRVFAEDGLEVSLGRIAQLAGVGAGTVYRHFPSKEILVEAVLTEHVESLVAAADRWAARATPGDALFGFLLEVIENRAAASTCATRSLPAGAGRTPCSPPRHSGSTRHWTACCATRNRLVRYAPTYRPTTWPH
jgi:AcrR family transcriptional regulator